MSASKTPSGSRQLKKRVKTARKRSNSSTRWLARQLNDPYVHRARQEGYRSRAAFKISELDDKFHFFKPGKIVLDLGAAPGGWSQVAAARVKSTPEQPSVIALDILDMSPLNSVHFLKMDFMHDDAPEKLRSRLPKGADIVLSDMAPNTTGHAPTDHLRIMALMEAAYMFACEVLKPGGVFVSKIFQGGTEQELLKLMKQHFSTVKHAKPKASRADSSEIYVVAMGYRK